MTQDVLNEAIAINNQINNLDNKINIIKLAYRMKFEYGSVIVQISTADTYMEQLKKITIEMLEAERDSWKETLAKL